MHIVFVHVHVTPGEEQAFRKASALNAGESAKEPGVVRFDVFQQTDDPTRFVLVEIYRTAEDPVRHKQTAHYQEWRIAVEPLMAEPRSSVKYEAVHFTGAR